MKRVVTSLTVLASLTLTACAPEQQTDSPQPPPAETTQAPAEPDTPETTPAEVEPTVAAETEQTTTPQEPAPGETTTAGAEPSAAPSPSAAAAELEGRAVPADTVKSWVENPATAPGKMVFLTFDDGPNDTRTPGILKVLQDKGVKATFFIVGSTVPNAPEVLKAERDAGMGICLHSQTHDYKKLYPGRKANPTRIAQEWDQSLAAARQVLGQDFTTSCWRYPGGHMSWKKMEGADKALADKGAAWIDWNAMTGDAEPKKNRPSSKSSMVRMATAPIDNGVKTVVVLAHDTPDKQLTEESLPDIIDAYREAGYAFGVIS